MPSDVEIQRGMAEVEAAARVLLPSLFWQNTEGWYQTTWEAASMAQRDSARDTAAEMLEASAWASAIAAGRGEEARVSGEGETT